MLAPSRTEDRALHWLAPDPVFPPAPVAPPRHRSLVPLLLTALLVIAAALWAWSLQVIDPASLDHPGLPRALPVSYAVALGCLCLAFAVALRAGLPRWTLASLFGIAIVLYATAPALYDAPRYAFAYKHIAVIHYIELHGTLDRSVDIYQNWPGFFSANALIAQVTGIDPLKYANWTQLLFPLLNLLALRFAFSAFTSRWQRAHIAMALFLLTEWVDQGYLAPQSFAYFITLIILGVALRWLRPDGTERVQRVIVRVTHIWKRLTRWIPWPGRRRAPAPETSQLLVFVNGATASRVFAISLILMLAVSVITSHQLTPFFICLNLGVLVLTRRSRSWWLPVAIGVLTLVWIALAHTYLASHGLAVFGGNPIANAQPANHPAPAAGSSWKETVAWTARSLSAVLMCVAAFGVLADRLAGRRQAAAVMLAVVAPLLAVFQSYGGEGIYRIYLFLVPWLAYLAAGFVVGRARRPGPVRTAVIFVGMAALCGAFVVAYFGLDNENHMTQQEISASQWFETNAPAGAEAVFLIANHPFPISGNYDEHMTENGQTGLDLFTAAAYYNAKASTPLTPKVVYEIVAYSKNPRYLILSPSQLIFAQNHGYGTPASLTALTGKLLRSSHFEVLYAHDGNYVLRPRPLVAAVPAVRTSAKVPVTTSRTSSATSSATSSGAATAKRQATAR